MPFVLKDDNPPNVPQARPIERFLAILKRAVYDGGWEAKSEQHLVGRIKRELKQIKFSVIQAIMKTIHSQQGKIEDNGPLSAV